MIASYNSGLLFTSQRIRVLALIIFLHLGISPLFAQTNNTTHLQTWIIQTFPEAKLDEETLYMIDGVPISQEKIEIELTKYNPNELNSIAYLDEEIQFSQILCRPLDNVVLIATNYKGSRKWLKENSKKAKELFAKTSYPALIIDGEPIDPKESKPLIREFKLSQIKNIMIVSQPVSVEHYGENGANGLVMIVKR